MFKNARTHNFDPVFDKCRQLIKANKPGANIIRYLLHTLKNKVIKNQYTPNSNDYLSSLNLKYGCIPFDEMPYASTLVLHTTTASELSGIDVGYYKVFAFAVSAIFAGLAGGLYAHYYTVILP